MYCIKCGKTIEVDSLFCPYCGSKNGPEEGHNEEVSLGQQHINKSKRERKSTVAKILLCIIAFVFVGVISYVSISQTRISRQFAHGQKYMEEHDYERAIETYEKILADSPNNISASYGIAEAYYEYGQEVESDDEEQAITLYQKSMKYGNMIEVYIACIQLCLDEEDYEQARDILEQAEDVFEFDELSVLSEEINEYEASEEVFLPAYATEEAAPAAEEAEAPEAPAAEEATAGGLVGVAMPTKVLQRWNQDGENMKAQLEEAGYEVNLHYAENDIDAQVSQIENMIAGGCQVLVIGAIDGNELGTVLEQAKEAGVPVIAYDRLIMNTDAVSYYASFDNYKVGTMQGEYVRDALDLENAEGPFNVEFLAGDPGDNNALLFYVGAMDVLKEYIDAGKIVVQSGQTKFDEVATASWSTENAQSRMENIISSYYADGTLIDAICCSNDSTSLGAQNALESSYNGEWPVLTGQDCDIANIPNIIAGKQSMSVFKDTRDLAAKTVEMVDAIMKGGEAPVNNTTDYDNGIMVVPSYLCAPKIVDQYNYKDILIGSGYYTENQLR